jgi:hypothetical protein
LGDAGGAGCEGKGFLLNEIANLHIFFVLGMFRIGQVIGGEFLDKVARQVAKGEVGLHAEARGAEPQSGYR